MSSDPTESQLLATAHSSRKAVGQNHGVILELRDLESSYGGVQAVAGVSLTVRAGSFTGLIGPNGAGKTTLVDCISGLRTSYSGKVLFSNRDVTHLHLDMVARLGMIRTFQVPRLFDRLSLTSNLMAAPAKQSGERLLVALTNRWRSQEAKLLARGRQLLDRFSLVDVRDNYGLELSGGQRRLAELSRAAMAQPTMLLLDEPFAGVSPANRSHLAELLRSLNRDFNMTVLMIEHRLELIEQLCDDIIVMADGRVIGRGSMEQLRRDPKVVDAYLGEVGKIATSN
jgi:branched-chain amino acid transport system ATP-binding protein